MHAFGGMTGSFLKRTGLPLHQWALGPRTELGLGPECDIDFVMWFCDFPFLWPMSAFCSPDLISSFWF